MALYNLQLLKMWSRIIAPSPTSRELSSAELKENAFYRQLRQQFHFQVYYFHEIGWNWSGSQKQSNRYACMWLYITYTEYIHLHIYKYNKHEAPRRKLWMLRTFPTSKTTLEKWRRLFSTLWFTVLTVRNEFTNIKVKLTEINHILSSNVFEHFNHKKSFFYWHSLILWTCYNCSTWSRV